MLVGKPFLFATRPPSSPAPYVKLGLRARPSPGRARRARPRLSPGHGPATGSGVHLRYRWTNWDDPPIRRSPCHPARSAPSSGADPALWTGWLRHWRKARRPALVVWRRRRPRPMPSPRRSPGPATPGAPVGGPVLGALRLSGNRSAVRRFPAGGAGRASASGWVSHDVVVVLGARCSLPRRRHRTARPGRHFAVSADRRSGDRRLDPARHPR